MKKSPQAMPKEHGFTFASPANEALELLPSVVEVGADLEYKGVVRVGGFCPI